MSNYCFIFLLIYASYLIKDQTTKMEGTMLTSRDHSKKTSTESNFPAYTLRVGKHDEERLAISDEIYGPSTRAFLINSGIRAGMRVLDVGCGPGNISCWLAEQVGEDGNVVAVDISDESLSVAATKASEHNITNIQFVQCAADELDRIEGTFDMVFCRFLLIHLTDPKRALLSMASKLNENGILCCEEPTTYTHSCYPTNRFFDKANLLTQQLGNKKGVDYNFGEKIFSLFQELFDYRENIKINFFQTPILSRRHKQIFPMSFDQVSGQLLSENLVTADEVDELKVGLWDFANADPHKYFVCGFRKTQIYTQVSRNEEANTSRSELK
jgi:ubiquinone/menaquinone biosynthesis C-methylase UbiE